ncbi:hypothetical protein DIPPA_18443 [Diplonema papillatum]|nr:hypothetical protein DIPPA_18443 [Diplonema papillatum]
MDKVKVFIKTPDKSNDDAVLATVSRDQVPSEVIQTVLPLLFARGCEPPIADLQLRLDGQPTPLKNRMPIGSMGINFNSDTFVIESRAGSSTCTTPVMEAVHPSAATPPSMGYASEMRRRDGQGLGSVQRHPMQGGHMDYQAMHMSHSPSPARMAATPMLPSQDTSMAAHSLSQSRMRDPSLPPPHPTTPHQQRYSQHAYADTPPVGAPHTPQMRTPGSDYYNDDDADDQYDMGTPNRRQGSAGNALIRSSSHVSGMYDLSPAKSWKRPSKGKQQCFMGNPTASFADFANGGGEPSAGRPDGRRPASQQQRALSTSLPNDFAEGVLLTSTKRDDGLGFSGNIQGSIDMPRLRRAHGHNDAAHMQSTIGDWWGHRGGYPDNACRLQAKTSWKEGEEGLKGSWMRPVVPHKKGPAPYGHPDLEDHIELREGSFEGSEGSLSPGRTGYLDNSLVPNSSKKHLPQQCSHLDMTLSPPPEPKTGRRIVEHQNKIDHEYSPSPRRGFGLGAGACQQLSRSNVPLGVPPYSVSRRRAGSAAMNKTFSSSVGNFMLNEDATNEMGNHRSATSMVLKARPLSASEPNVANGSIERVRRKGKTQEPNSFGCPVVVVPGTSLEVPQVKCETIDALRLYLREKVALCGGKGKGELQEAWKKLTQHSTTNGTGMTKSDFRTAVGHEFAAQISEPELVALLHGEDKGRVTFYDFTVMCRVGDIAPSPLNQTPPTNLANRVQYGDRGVRIVSQQPKTLQAPYGIQGDEPGPLRTCRRQAF